MNLKMFVVGAVILLSFVMFSRSVRTGVLNPIDFAVTIKLQERIDSSTHLRLTDVIGNVMEGSSFFASPEFSLAFLFALTCIICIDFKKKKFYLQGLIVPVLFGLLVCIEIYGKSVIHHPSPPFFLIKNTTSIFPKYYINDQFSYPSGHTARAVFLGLVFYSLFIISVLPEGRQNLKFNSGTLKMIVAFGVTFYVVMVATSRIYLGHHWFSDIVGGMLLGLAMWSFVGAFMGLLTRGKPSHIIPKR